MRTSAKQPESSSEWGRECTANFTEEIVGSVELMGSSRARVEGASESSSEHENLKVKTNGTRNSAVAMKDQEFLSGIGLGGPVTIRGRCLARSKVIAPHHLTDDSKKARFHIQQYLGWQPLRGDPRKETTVFAREVDREFERGLDHVAQHAAERATLFGNADCQRRWEVLKIIGFFDGGFVIIQARVEKGRHQARLAVAGARSRSWGGQQLTYGWPPAHPPAGSRADSGQLWSMRISSLQHDEIAGAPTPRNQKPSCLHYNSLANTQEEGFSRLAESWFEGNTGEIDETYLSAASRPLRQKQIARHQSSRRTENEDQGIGSIIYRLEAYTNKVIGDVRGFDGNGRLHHIGLQRGPIVQGVNETDAPSPKKARLTSPERALEDGEISEGKPAEKRKRKARRGHRSDRVAKENARRHAERAAQITAVVEAAEATGDAALMDWVPALQAAPDAEDKENAEEEEFVEDVSIPSWAWHDDESGPIAGPSH
ncbi:hypothetical protein DFH07DRAFT_764842 [Mycena maculata]|uniref:Uncharacterized protein n=1 Tax=Mycena maculata TaxID=230809 RepID=A0AAD7NZU8_9AGAR|nr:hypothetical protein DFH07DRAFT_764842 [Mycena maculata]